MDPKTDNTRPTCIPPPRGYALSGKIMLTAVVFLITIALLLLFIHLYLRWHVQRSHGRRRRQRLDFAPVEDDRSATDVRPLGLDPKVLNSLPTLVTSSGDDAAECAVCLGELKDGEQVRVLHRCDHRFHVHCIDTWFGLHNSCPLCRSAAEPPPPKAEAAAIERSSGLGSGEVRIQIRSGEELGLGSGSEGKGWMLAILRLLGRREVDLERGGGAGAVRASPPLPAE